ncbi:MAG: zinc ribbon domain-containing protein [Candidatus Tectomicrobia bacterium]|nr:zinc ribbon domain-containing protein [Candidatus Tectomicrobia bacterium]
MIGTDLIILVLIAAGLVIFIGEPLVRRHPHETLDSAQDREVDQLTLQKETLYMAIRDLDFDYHTGKVDEQDFTELRSRLENEAIAILRDLDKIDPFAGLDDELECQIAALRQTRSATAVAALSDLSAPSVCTHCGTPLQGDENFCAVCGHSLRVS